MCIRDRSTIKEISEKYGFRFSRSLGQNFITDRNVLNKIVEGAEIGPEDLVIEIGPGFGALTAELTQVSSRVVAIELDSRLIPILQSTLKEYDNVELVNRDILKADIGTIIDEYRDTGKFTGKARIAGNLPYYITTPIIMKILESEADVDSITAVSYTHLTEKAFLMTDNGFTPDYMDIKYDCSDCRDTGMLETGEKCQCLGEVTKEKIRLLKTKENR